MQRSSWDGGQQKKTMKQTLLLTVVIFFIIGCEKSKQVENNSLVGKWKLTESYADPGDGSGTWQPADAAHPGYLEFKTDGTVIITPYNIDIVFLKLYWFCIRPVLKVAEKNILLFIKQDKSILQQSGLFTKKIVDLNYTHFPICVIKRSIFKT